MAFAPSSPLRKLVIGRLIGRSAKATDLAFYTAPSASGSWQNPTLARRRSQRRPATQEASYHRATVPLSGIDESVFFSLFGGSVQEYARFFAGVSFEGLNFRDAEELESVLSGGANSPTTIITQNSRAGTEADIPHAEVSRAEWAGLHTELNGGSPMSSSKQLPYFFDCAAAWGGALSPATESLPTALSATYPFAGIPSCKQQALHC